MCIEPPLPLQMPVRRPKSSAIMPRTSTPLAMQWPWPRCVEVTTSRSREVGADADGDGLLAGVEMQEAGELPGHHQLRELLLEDADGAHPPVHVHQRFGGERRHGSSVLAFGGRVGSALALASAFAFALAPDEG